MQINILLSELGPGYTIKPVRIEDGQLVKNRLSEGWYMEKMPWGDEPMVVEDLEKMHSTSLVESLNRKWDVAEQDGTSSYDMQ